VKAKKQKMVSVKIPVDLRESLARIAVNNGLKIQWMAAEAVRAYIVEFVEPDGTWPKGAQSEIETGPGRNRDRRST
jgi:hypothetical protein